MKGRRLLGLALAQLMVILDISAVNVALPDLAKDLALGPNELSWTITSYSVKFGSLLLLGGRAADLLGRRRMFLAGLHRLHARVRRVGDRRRRRDAVYGMSRTGTRGSDALPRRTLDHHGDVQRRSRRTRPCSTSAAFSDRPISGGFVIMLPGAAVLFRPFLLTSLYLQNVLGATALETGFGFLPFAIVTAGAVHGGTHAINSHGPRMPMAIGFALTAGGMLLLAGVSQTGSTSAMSCPDGDRRHRARIVLVRSRSRVLAGATEEESGMLSGLNTTGYEIGGSIGLAVLTSIAVTAVAPGHVGAATGSPTRFWRPA